jgi:hypothetical protein
MIAPRHAKTIGLIELRRRWRSLRGNAAQLLALAFAGLFGLLFVAVVLFGAFFFGVGVRSGGIEAPIELARSGLVYVWISLAAFGGYRAYTTALRPDRLDGLLTTVSHRELLGGLVFAEAVLWGVPGSALVGLCALLFALGTGSPIAAPLAFLTVGFVAATALTVGWLGALSVRNTGVRSKLLTRLRTALLAAIGLGYFWLLLTQSFDTVLEPLYSVLEPTPLGWYGDLLLVGTVEGASPVRAGGAVLVSAGVLLASAVALSRLAAWLWYADGVSIEHGDAASASASSGKGSRLDAFLPRPVVGVLLRDWTRARRAPIALSFVVYPAFVLFRPVMTTVRTGTVGWSFPTLVVLSGAWVTGALFSLNVLGNEGAALPATLLADEPGRWLVVGHAVAAGIVGVPATVAATVALAVAGPHPFVSVLTLASSALVLTLCAGPIASGIGVAFPRFEEVSVSRSTEAIVPSLLAFVVYSAVLGIVALPTLLGHSAIVGHALASWFDLARATVGLAGTALSGGLGIGVGIVSARYAIRSVGEFRFE